MYVALSCPSCPCRFRAAADTPADELIGRMIDEGPWFALAEGCTFEAMVAAALARRGRILCPECLDPVNVHELSFDDAASEALAAG
jgi:hypothetical protein